MSRMSNTRSRTQNITLKLTSLDSVPSNWVKRYNFLLLLPNALSEGHFVEHTEQNEQLHGQNLNFSWDLILLNSAPLNYVKMSGFKALLKIAPNVLFFGISH